MKLHMFSDGRVLAKWASMEVSSFQIGHVKLQQILQRDKIKFIEKIVPRRANFRYLIAH